jgi:putative nucleotidyltransferase with HDIG domain
MFKRLTDKVENYIKSFYCDDEFINEQVALKHVHTRKVTQIMQELASELKLDAYLCEIAAATGLLHDIGRFEQVKKYRTFLDAKSVSHALLGIRIIQELGLVSGYEKDFQASVLAAVKHHSDLEVSAAAGLPEHADLMIRMIRDADKLDIFRVIKIAYEKLQSSGFSEQQLVTFGISRAELTDECSETVLEDLLSRRQASYGEVKTITDRKLLQLCWVFDFNFSQSLIKAIESGHINYIFNILPKTAQMDLVKAEIIDYISAKLAHFKPITIS